MGSQVAWLGRMLVVLAATSGCATRGEDRPVTQSEKSELGASLDAEIARLHADPLAVVGFGGKAYMPYHLGGDWGLVTTVDGHATVRLLAEARDRGNPIAVRLAALHVLAFREDPAVDDALIACLTDPELRGLAAYLLGRIDFKGYPRRDRATAAIVDALRAHLGDGASYDDPWYRRTFLVSDLVLAAILRLTGPEQYTFTQPDVAEWIGWDLPHFTDAEREQLTAQVRKR